MRLLLRIKAGLGDQNQATIIIKHLKHYHPDWFVGVESPIGCHSCFYGVADAVHIMRHPMEWRESYDEIIRLPMPHCEQLYFNVPSTKPTRTLVEVFHLQPINELYRYEINPSAEVEAKVDRFIQEELEGKPYGILHTLGTARKEQKNLSNQETEILINSLFALELTPVLLDWDAKVPLSEDCGVIRPDKRHPYLWDGERVGDAATIAALIDRAEVFFGIDSGPAHIAAATDTPSFVLWWETNPAYCFDPAPNVTHLVPYWALESLPSYFQENYDVITWGEEDESLEDRLKSFLSEIATLPAK